MWNRLVAAAQSMFDRPVTELNLSRSRKSPRNAMTINEIIHQVHQHPQLVSLDVSGQQLTPIELLNLFQHLQTRPMIQSVNISRNYLNHASHEHLIALVKAIARCKMLTSLTIAENGLENKTALFLVNALTQICPTITSIGLSGNRIDAEGAHALSHYPITINLEKNPIETHTIANLATEVRQLTFGEPDKNGVCYTQKTKIENPIELHNFWKRHSIDTVFPSLFQLSLFKVKSTPDLQEKANQVLPMELQDAVRRNVIF